MSEANKTGVAIKEDNNNILYPSIFSIINIIKMIFFSIINIIYLRFIFRHTRPFGAPSPFLERAMNVGFSNKFGGSTPFSERAEKVLNIKIMCQLETSPVTHFSIKGTVPLIDETKTTARSFGAGCLF